MLTEREAARTRLTHTALSFPGCVGRAPALLLEQSSPDGAPACVLEGAPTLGLRTPVSHPSCSPSARSPAAPPRPAQALTIVAAAWPAPLLCQKSGRAQSLGGSRGAERGRGGGTLSEQRLGPSSNRKQTATATGVLRAPPPGPLATSFGW